MIEFEANMIKNMPEGGFNLVENHWKKYFVALMNPIPVCFVIVNLEYLQEYPKWKNFTFHLEEFLCLTGFKNQESYWLFTVYGTLYRVN